MTTCSPLLDNCWVCRIIKQLKEKQIFSNFTCLFSPVKVRIMKKTHIQLNISKMKQIKGFFSYQSQILNFFQFPVSQFVDLHRLHFLFSHNHSVPDTVRKGLQFTWTVEVLLRKAPKVLNGVKIQKTHFYKSVHFEVLILTLTGETKQARWENVCSTIILQTNSCW